MVPGCQISGRGGLYFQNSLDFNEKAKFISNIKNSILLRVLLVNAFFEVFYLEKYYLPWGSNIPYIINIPKRRNPPCAAPPLSSFPMGKKLDTTQRGAAQGVFLLLGLFIM